MPSHVAASASAAATPRIMFEPSRLATGPQPGRSATMLRRRREVVVLPFVPVTSTLPLPELRGQPGHDAGVDALGDRPGSAVPPPSAAAG